ncbi:hypothetical protein CLOSTHATH_03920 [Hungatella hathewayi DSM 13479]|uniref:Uncharacterized protein n=1 Tax=Hungatella hathewayi DSM 13479 TaxID=566550 RepID=D3AJX6_9FIRM|nr:hypothetical protein CLOSTHATH_03920 [Hungatella hathewayi DSM 13479]
MILSLYSECIIPIYLSSSAYIRFISAYLFLLSLLLPVLLLPVHPSLFPCSLYIIFSPAF